MKFEPGVKWLASGLQAALFLLRGEVLCQDWCSRVAGAVVFVTRPPSSGRSFFKETPMIAMTPRKSAAARDSKPVDFLRLMPLIRRHARESFRSLDPEARDEAVQETVANAFVAYTRLVERHKLHVIAALPLARYAVAQIRTGRRVGGSLNIRDVSSGYCQQRQGVLLERLDRVVDSEGVWEQVLVEDRSSTPADIVAIRLDFQSWLASLPERHRQIAEVLSTGEASGIVARLFEVSSARVSQLRAHFKATWLAFQGEEPAALFASA